MRESKVKSAMKYVYPALPPILLFAVFQIVKRDSGAVNVYVSRFAYPLRTALGKFSSHLPFSLMELFYTALVLWVIFFLVRTVYILIKRDRTAAAFFKRLFILLLVAFYIAALYSMLFGLDYYAQSFSEKSGLDASGIYLSDLENVTRYFALKASEYSRLVERDENGSVCEELDDIFAFAKSSYDGITDEFPFLDSEIFTPKKMAYSKIMSYMGFTGVYFPFTGESNVNVHSPRAFIPDTVTHEIAHQKGVTSEAECNFIGVAAAVSSQNMAYRYSGYLSGLVHLMNALGRADPELWRELRAGFSEELDHDWEENRLYWDRMEIHLTHVTENIYDKYLKSYGQTLGMASYGACVNLLVTYFAEEAAENVADL